VLTSDGLDERDYVAIESEAPLGAPEQEIAALARRADRLQVGAAEEDPARDAGAGPRNSGQPWSTGSRRAWPLDRIAR
jgi:hypothetical protein